MEAARVATSTDLSDLTWVAQSVIAEQQVLRGGDLFHRREAVGLLPTLEVAVAEGRVIAGTYDDVVLGLGVYEIEPLGDGTLLGRVEALAVLSAARGSGIGEAMMNFMVSQLSDAGCFGIDAAALPGDRNTKNFFESFGLKARMLRVHLSLET